MVCKDCKRYIDEIKSLKNKKKSLGLEFNKLDSKEWIVVEKRPKKDILHYIHNQDVILVNNIIKEFFEYKNVVNAREIWYEIKRRKNLHISLDSFNGGKNRTNVYFPFYYYPMKILDHEGKINYHGSGYIKNNKEE